MEPPAPRRAETIKQDEARLRAARMPLLKLHKALLEAEKIAYEKQNGRIENPGAFLQLLMSDPWFAWLRPISQLIVLIDEHLEAGLDQPETSAVNLLRQARELTTPEGRYAELIQAHPEVALARRDVSRALEEPDDKPRH